MGYSSTDAGGRLGLLNNQSFVTMESYLVLHQEITALAYQYTNEIETAKDIASECLIDWWQQACDNEQVQKGRNCFTGIITTVYDIIRTCTKQRRLSEHCFIQDQLVHIPAYKVFMVAEKELILRFSRLLQPHEQTVIRLILIDGFDLPEISAIMKKTVPSVKIIRDRATFLLRKNFLQVDNL